MDPPVVLGGLQLQEGLKEGFSTKNRTKGHKSLDEVALSIIDSNLKSCSPFVWPERQNYVAVMA